MQYECEVVEVIKALGGFAFAIFILVFMIILLQAAVDFFL